MEATKRALIEKRQEEQRQRLREEQEIETAKRKEKEEAKKREKLFEENVRKYQIKMSAMFMRYKEEELWYEWVNTEVRKMKDETPEWDVERAIKLAIDAANNRGGDMGMNLEKIIKQ